MEREKTYKTVVLVIVIEKTEYRRATEWIIKNIYPNKMKE